MAGFVDGGAGSKTALKVIEINQEGVLLVEVENKGAKDAVISFERLGSSVRQAYSDQDTANNTQTISDGEALSTTPVLPKTLTLTGTGVPTAVDRDGDGTLRIDRIVGSVVASGDKSGTTSAAATRTLTDAGASFVTAGVHAGDSLVVSDLADHGVYTITAVAATVLTVDRDWPTGGTASCTYAVNAADLNLGTVNYFTGGMELSYPADAAPAGHATALSTVDFPINLNPGDVLNINVDGGGATAATFDAAQATLAGSGGTFAAMASESFEVQFGTDEVQTVTFGTEATQQAAVDLINTQIIGGEARINGANVDLVSDQYGTGGRVRTTNVDAGVTTKLGIANSGDQSGTGDVADINAVTFAEAQTVIEADVTDVDAVSEDGKLRVTNTSSNTGASSTLAFTGINAKFGLAAGPVDGADAGAEENLSATYDSGFLLEAGKRKTYRLTNLPGENIAVYATGKAGGTKVRVTY